MKYIKFEIYTAPNKPTEYGTYYSSTPILSKPKTQQKESAAL